MSNLCRGVLRLLLLDIFPVYAIDHVSLSSSAHPICFVSSSALIWTGFDRSGSFVVFEEVLHVFTVNSQKNSF